MSDSDLDDITDKWDGYNIEVDQDKEDEDWDDDQETEEGRKESDDAEVLALEREINKTYKVSVQQLAIGKSALSKCDTLVFQIESTLTLKQIQRLTKHICHLSILTADLLACCKTAKIDAKKLTRPVATQWNSMTQAMQRALDIKPALDHLVDYPQHNTSHGPKLRQFKLSDEEWNFVALLCKILQVRVFYFIIYLFSLTFVSQNFLKMTLRISRSSTPLLHEVIPLIDVLTKLLDKKIIDTSLPISTQSSTSTIL